MKWWVVIGFVGQTAFFMRFLKQLSQFFGFVRNRETDSISHLHPLRGYGMKSRPSFAWTTLPGACLRHRGPLDGPRRRGGGGGWHYPTSQPPKTRLRAVLALWATIPQGGAGFLRASMFERPTCTHLLHVRASYRGHPPKVLRLLQCSFRSHRLSV